MIQNIIYDVIIIGGGPAGMMAAGNAAKNGCRTCLVEKNRDLGTKLLLTGKGRCNLTNDKSIADFVKAFGKNGPFLYSILNQFSNDDVKVFFEQRGLALKLEHGGRYFPVSDDAASVVRMLISFLKENKVRICSGFTVVKVAGSQNGFTVFGLNKDKLFAKHLIIATGGKSYATSGSSGDGYGFAGSFGHSIATPEPALVPLVCRNNRIRNLQGLSLKNVDLSIITEDQNLQVEKKETSLFGEMLFTHFGITGPIVLTLSHEVFNLLQSGKKVFASIDFKPALDFNTLDLRLRREFLINSKKTILTVLKNLLPQALIPYFLERVNLDEEKKCAEIARAPRLKIIKELKDFRFEIQSTLPVEAGIITAGGVDLTEINPKTLESKLFPHLYFAGEILDLDGPSGGYNLTVAFATGFVAGSQQLMK